MPGDSTIEHLVVLIRLFDKRLKVMWKRIAAGVFSVAAIGCGVLGCGYSVAVSADIGQIGVPIWAALLGNTLFWLLTIGAFGIGADFIKFAISGNSFRVPPRVRAVGIGVLGFFPAFLIALLAMGSYEVLRHPNDPQAFLRTLVVSLAFALASVPTVAVFLLKKSYR